jgi:hypothetical protein
LALDETDFYLLACIAIFQWCSLCVPKVCETFLCKEPDGEHLVCPSEKGLLGKSDDFFRTLDKFVEENGTDALKKLVNQVHEPYTSTPTSYFFTLI